MHLPKIFCLSHEAKILKIEWFYWRLYSVQRQDSRGVTSRWLRRRWWVRNHFWDAEWVVRGGMANSLSSLVSLALFWLLSCSLDAKTHRRSGLAWASRAQRQAWGRAGRVGQRSWPLPRILEAVIVQNRERSKFRQFCHLKWKESCPRAPVPHDHVKARPQLKESVNWQISAWGVYPTLHKFYSAATSQICVEIHTGLWLESVTIWPQKVQFGTLAISWKGIPNWGRSFYLTSPFRHCKSSSDNNCQVLLSLETMKRPIPGNIESKTYLYFYSFICRVHLWTRQKRGGVEPNYDTVLSCK